MSYLRLNQGARIRDVAEALGISKTTVSLVMNGRADKVGISLATRQRVLDMAREMAYIPNPAALAMATGFLAATMVDLTPSAPEPPPVVGSPAPAKPPTQVPVSIPAVPPPASTPNSPTTQQPPSESPLSVPVVEVPSEERPASEPAEPGSPSTL